MPTVEERLAALEYALSNVMRQLHELASFGQRMDRRFDALEKALVYQFNALNTSINARFEAQDTRMVRVEQRFEQQAIDFRWKFDESNHYAVETRGIVEMQQKDIREIKGRLGTLENKVDSLENKVDRRFDQMDLRFDQVIALITKQNN